MVNFSNKNKISYKFFIFAFTLAFLSFSMGYSSLNSQNEKLKKYDGKTNKYLSIKSRGINHEKLIESIKDLKVTVQLRHTLINTKNNSSYEITTQIKGDGFSRLGDLRYGDYLSNNEYNSEEEIGVFSNVLTKEKIYTIIDEAAINEMGIDIKEKGRTFDTDMYLDVPNKVFFRVAKTNDLGSGLINIILSGKEKEVSEGIKDIKSYVSEMDSYGIVDVYEFQTRDIGTDGKRMFQVSFLIIIITILNSISISYLWVQDNKKELTIRKVCGAKNKDLAKIFFGRLISISTISVIISVILQIVIDLLCKGVFYNLDIRLSFSNIIASFIFSFGVTFISSLPAIFYIQQIKPVSMLKGE